MISGYAYIHTIPQNIKLLFFLNYGLRYYSTKKKIKLPHMIKKMKNRSSNGSKKLKVNHTFETTIKLRF